MKKFKSICSIAILLLIMVIGYTIADNLQNNVEVEPSTELTYYLNVKYDGVDVSGISSSDNVVANVQSDIIFVEDKLPLGLTFIGFVTTDDGSIGSVKRDNSEVSCLGKVIDDTNEVNNSGVWNNDHTEYTYHGLHYDATSRTVSFRVKDLQAGCVLNVGIITNTPSTIDDRTTNNIEKRRDFYNYATIRERVINDASNLVHVFIGSTNEDMYTVTYEYLSGTDSNAPMLPQTTSYAAGSTVSVSTNPYFEGYTFNGWVSNDVTISNGTFTMPSSNVVIKGSFTQNSNYQVSYSIDGATPSGYVLPSNKSYYTNTLVYLDSLKSGDIINGYKFLGWSSNDVDISYNSFEMPNKNVSIVGSFSPINYQVNYQFIGNVMPEDSENYLPISSNHSEGDIVVLPNVSDVSGYKFLGWFKDDGFTMPSKDITVYGEWKRFSGYFEPTISIEVVNSKDYYKLGDKIRYKITVTNTANYPIKNVIIKENINATYVSSNDYTIQNNLATINEIDANSSKILYSDYIVTSNDSNTINNEVEIRSAIADNDYELKEKNYKVSTSSNLKSVLNICTIVNTDVSNSFRFKIANNTYDYSIILGSNECMNLYLEPGTYSVKELIPQEYNLQSVTGSITANNQSLTVVQGNSYQINFTNNFKLKKFMHAFGDVVNTVEGGQ